MKPRDIPGIFNVRFLGLDFATQEMAEVLRLVAGRPPGAPFAYVTTPNADHLVRLARNPGLAPLYEAAWLRLLDSRLIARLAAPLGLRTPPVVPGSDLTAALFGGVIRPEDSLAVLGGTPDTIAVLRARYGLNRLAHHDPPMGFDRDPAALEVALQFLEAHPARYVFLAVGSPRQELVAEALVRRGRATGTGLCVGASLLFLTGAERRAPRVMQQAGMEWAWRLVQDPKRLARRYWGNAAILRMLWAERQSAARRA